MPFDKIVLILTEFFTGYLLQAIAFVLFVYAFNKRRIDKLKFIITTAIMMVFIYISRNMNINLGVHTIFNIILLIVLTVFYCKMPIKRCTLAALFVTLITIVFEICNICVMMLIFTPPVFKVKVKDPLWNAITAIPVTTCLLILSIVFYKLRTRGNTEIETNSRQNSTQNCEKSES